MENKRTGMVRYLDNLGRYVVPAELRKIHGIVPGTELEMYYDDKAEAIVMMKYVPGCNICGFRPNGSQPQLYPIGEGKQFCEMCVSQLSDMQKVRMK